MLDIYPVDIYLYSRKCFGPVIIAPDVERSRFCVLWQVLLLLMLFDSQNVLAVVHSFASCTVCAASECTAVECTGHGDFFWLLPVSGC